MRRSVLLTLRRSNWVPLAVLGLLLMLAVIFLYEKTRDYDPSSYVSSVTLLRQIKQVDARWELDAMKTKIGLNKNYDPLADPLLELKELQQKLDALTAGKKGSEALKLTKAIAAFEGAMKEKGTAIEHFKSHNSVLENSLIFLPSAAEDIRIRLNQGRPQDQDALKSIKVDLDKALMAGLLYDDNGGTKEMAIEIEQILDRIASSAKNLPTDLTDRVDIFALHMRTILRETTAVSALLDRIVTMPTSARIDDINNILNKAHQVTDMREEQYRQYLTIFSTALIGLFLYAAFGLIRGHVINRINTELQHVNDSLERRVKQRTNELGEAQAQLVTSARLAGMAEIATNVLHNVGNVLNSVNVSAVLVSKQMRASKLQGLSRAVQMINEQAADLGTFLTLDPKGKMLPDYLNKLVKVVTAEQQGIIEELAQLTKSVDHIKEIIATQQSYAGVSGVFEQFEVRELIEDALRMGAGSLSRHHVAVVKEFDDVPPLWLDKHQVLQILINLLGNAKQAMNDRSAHPHQITLRLRKTERQTVEIHVVDNGEGIPPENLTRIFAHGFTTRKTGHGFGLHSCVLSAQEMGGSLTVQSEGSGKGATFMLELPIKEKEEVF